MPQKNAKKQMPGPVQVQILAIPETAGSALYGMLDVLMATGNIWQALVREAEQQLFEVAIVSPVGQPFRCGNRIPVSPDFEIGNAPRADIVILPEIWLGPDESIRGRYPEVMDWLRNLYDQGCHLYSACSGSVLLAESGLLDGCPATSHWGYQDLFRQQYPRVKFLPEPNLVFSDTAAHIVTAGGTTSWHDLAIYIISRHASPGEAMRIASVYLLKWHSEGQLPYTVLVRHAPHTDSIVRKCEDWLKTHYQDDQALARVEMFSQIPARSLKRRFKAATGCTMIEYLQNLRIEKAKRLLESSGLPVEDISAEVGYEDVSFFRRLFKRLTGLPPSHYRRLFQPVAKV